MLAYHGIGDVPLRVDRHGLFVRPQELSRQVRKLRAWGYELLSFGQLARRLSEDGGEGAAALTFDDGLAGNLETLDSLGVPATLFVVSGWLGGEHPDVPSARILTTSELRRLAEHGLEIGSHTRTHPDLTQLEDDAVRGELVGSKHDLEELLQRAVEVASYPYGLAGEATVRACSEAGYRAACASTGNGSWDDPHNLPRQDMNRGSTMLALRLKRDGLYEPLVRRLPGRALRALTRRIQLRLE